MGDAQESPTCLKCDDIMSSIEHCLRACQGAARLTKQLWRDVRETRTVAGVCRRRTRLRVLYETEALDGWRGSAGKARRRDEQQTGKPLAQP